MKKSPTWPILKSYTGKQLERIALPLGGIGTGDVCLGGSGDLRDWEIMSRPAKGYSPVMGQELAPVGPFLAVRAKAKGQAAIGKALEGPYQDSFHENAMGSMAPNHGLPRFSEASFHTTYPYGRVELSDKGFPLRAQVEAFNPLIPGNTDDSSLPVAQLRVTLKNPGSQPVDASVAFNLPNFMGDDGETPRAHAFQWSEKMKIEKDNRNKLRTAGKLRGIHMTSTGLPKDEETDGSIAIATDHKGAFSYRTNWAPFDGGDTLQEFWDDLLEDGQLENWKKKTFPHPCGTLCASMKIPAKSERSVTFYLTWHFPNRNGWTRRKEPCGTDCGCETPTGDPDNVGSYYARFYKDAWDAMKQIVPRLPKLEAQTIDFVRTITDSDLPEVVKEAALFNVSTMRSPTTIRIGSGHLMGFEGVFDHVGCCAGSCTHVWNYETTTGALFGDLASSMRDVEYSLMTSDNGLQSFRMALPFDRLPTNNVAAADGQMGSIIRFYREWQRSGDDAFLKKHWARVKAAMEFCWLPGGWDADQDGIMEGCQHNTMDVEYFGPNPQMTFWYFAALRAEEEMARHLGDDEFADKCLKLYENGRSKVDAAIFNGEYYEHKIVPVKSLKDIAKGLKLGAGAAADQSVVKPVKQLGAGCLVDQLVGVHQARLNGLGEVIPMARQKKTLRSILKYNFRKTFQHHFNHLRSYVAADDAGLVMASYPRGERPARPFPYWNEVMTGFEYTAAAHMIGVGMEKEGLQCIQAIRDRYDGTRRNPFNEAECGYHYARAMAAWSALEAWTGFSFSAVDKVIRFKPRAGTFPWSNGYAWGTVTMRERGKKWSVELQTLSGKLKAGSVKLDGFVEAKLKRDAGKLVAEF